MFDGLILEGQLSTVGAVAVRCSTTRRTKSIEDAALSRRCVCTEDTLETVVVRCGEDSWPEAGCNLSSAGQR